jgi:rubredoxin
MSLPYQKYQCFFCGHIYDEAAGLPDAGFPPGTRWNDIPDSWICPECGAMKSDFMLLEE